VRPVRGLAVEEHEEGESALALGETAPDARRARGTVGFRLHAEPFDGDEFALDAEQPLDDALRLLVASFTEVLVADDAVRVDEVQRRPVNVAKPLQIS
jgi:hypothetical protein